MPKIDKDTKQKILGAAVKVFHQNGYKGARTTLIAQEAGISRTMLHYYYSTKEALFEEVLTNTLGTVLGHLKRLLGQQQGLEQVVENLLDIVSDVLEEQPDLPSFIVNIMNESPETFLLLPLMKDDDLPAQLNGLLESGKQNGQVSPDLTGEDLLMNIYGLCAMPYLAAPYISAKENRDEAQMKTFIRQRRSKNLAFLLKGIKP